MPLKKLKQRWPKARILKSEKKGSRFVLQSNDHIIKVYTHRAWNPLRNPGKVEFFNTTSFIQAKISSHTPIKYKKTFDLKSFRWIEISHYKYLAMHSQSDTVLEIETRSEALKSVVRLLCEISLKGFFHTDTNPANILISQDANKAFIIDIEEVILSPESINIAAAFMIARFYHDSVAEHINFSQLQTVVKEVYEELKWSSYIENTMEIIFRFSNRSLSKAEKQQRATLLQGSKC